jgi:hypothetical protein
MKQWIGFVLFTALAAQEIPVQTLQPAGAVVFPFGEGYRVNQMKAAGGRLFALGLAKTGAELIRVDRDGGGLDRVIVPGRAYDFAVTADGEVTTLRNLRDASVVAGPFFAFGKPYTELRISPLLFRLINFGGGVAGTQDAPASEKADGFKRLSIGSASRTATMPDGSIAVVSTRSPTLRILTPSERFSAPMPLAAPEIVPEEELGESSIVIGGITVHEGGDIFCLVSPYSPAEGARVLRFDTQGKLKARLRLVKPEKIGPAFLATIGNRLYLGSPDGRAAFYEIP